MALTDSLSFRFTSSSSERDSESLEYLEEEEEDFDVR